MSSAPECITRTYKLTNRLAAAIKRYEEKLAAFATADAIDDTRVGVIGGEYWQCMESAMRVANLLAQQTRRARAKDAR